MLKIGKRKFVALSIAVLMVAFMTALPASAKPKKLSLDWLVLTEYGFVSGAVVT